MDGNYLNYSDVVGLLPQLVQKNPPHTTTLEAIASVFPKRIIVLESAVESAARPATFRHGIQAFELLWTLSTAYWESLHSGQGDVEARKCFGNVFSAQESEKLSKAGRTRRTFDYGGKPILM